MRPSGAFSLNASSVIETGTATARTTRIAAAETLQIVTAGSTDVPLLAAGIGEMVLSRDPASVLVAWGLGSCVALSVWDPIVGVAGLAHFMLPLGPTGVPPAKFVESGIDPFLEAFSKLGGSTRRAHLKAAGGASMLTVMTGGLDIGRRNSETLAKELVARGLTLKGSALGGTAGRTVQLSVGDGRFLVKSVSNISAL